MAATRSEKPEWAAELLVSPGSRRPPADRVDRLLGRWLAFVRQHPIVAHVSLAALLALIADRSLAHTLSHPSLSERLGVELASVLVALSVPLLLTLAALRGQFRQIFKIVADAPGPSAPVMLRFVSEELGSLERRLDALRLRGIRLAPTELSDWVRPRCFSATRGRYLATDVCLPSDFMRNFTGYLDAHARYIVDKGQAVTARVNLADASDLAADAARDPTSYRDYVSWHDDHGVALLHLAPAKAAELADGARLGRQPVDASLWVHELVMRTDFEPDGHVRVTLGLVDDPLYRGIREYLGAVLREATPFPRAAAQGD